MSSAAMSQLVKEVRPGPVADASRLQFDLADARDGRLATSLADLARTGFGNVDSARRAVTRLDRFDHYVSVDVDRVEERLRFEIVWTPMTAIIDLMLDWDLLDLDITIEELATWLDVRPVVARRALMRLESVAGAEVSVTDPWQTVHVSLDVDQCPLTTSPSCAG